MDYATGPSAEETALFNKIQETEESLGSLKNKIEACDSNQEDVKNKLEKKLAEAENRLINLKSDAAENGYWWAI